MLRCCLLPLCAYHVLQLDPAHLLRRHARYDTRRVLALLLLPAAHSSKLQFALYTYRLPKADAFSKQVSDLGISNDHHVVVYGGPDTASSARVWWMFRVFGHERVHILQGGLQVRAPPDTVAL